MTSFLSESYLKPKLIEPYLINKIIEEQNNEITFERKTISYIKDFILQHWKIISFLLIIFALFYWRYKEIQNLRESKKYENDTEYETSISESQ